MLAKENVLKAIKLEKPSRLPVVLFSGGAWTINNAGYKVQELLGKPELTAKIIIETNEKVRSDIVWAGSGYNNLPIRGIGGKLKFRIKGTPDVQEPVLKTIADIDKINMERLAEDEGINSIWQTAKLVEQAIGEHTLIGACGWGPFTLGAQAYGVERTMSAIYKDKAVINALMEFAVEFAFRYYEPFIKAGVRIISVAEPTSSGDLISRDHFAEFTLPYLKKFMQKTKALGAYNLLHICGNITNRLDLIPESEADVLSVDYKVDLAKVKEVVGGKMAFAGNLNPVDVMQNAIPEEVVKESQKCIEKAGQDGNYILMPGCDIGPGVPLENIQAMINTGLNWQL